MNIEPCLTKLECPEFGAFFLRDTVVLLMKADGELEFVVVRSPHHCRLVRYEEDNVLPVPVILFDMDDLSAGKISIEHKPISSDAGAATMDAFSIMACLSQYRKRSGPRTIHVAIAARNVQPPYLTNHRVLKVNIGRLNITFVHITFLK